MGAPPHAPGDFLPDEKVTKESPRGGPPLGTPPRGTLRSPCSTSCCYPLKRACATEKDRFATLSLWANRSCFFLWFHRGNTLCFQSVARQAPWLRGCRRFYTPATNTPRAQGRGIKGGEAPFAGGPGTRRFLAYLCLLSLREKVGRGAGRSARSWGAGAKSADLLPRGEAPRKEARVPHPPLGRERKRGSAEGAPAPSHRSRQELSAKREKKGGEEG